MEITNEDGSLGLGTSDTLFKTRKKPCLYVRKDNSYYKIASFNDTDSMKDFWKVLVDLDVIKPQT